MKAIQILTLAVMMMSISAKSFDVLETGFPSTDYFDMIDAIYWEINGFRTNKTELSLYVQL